MVRYLDFNIAVYLTFKVGLVAVVFIIYFSFKTNLFILISNLFTRFP